MGFKGKKTSVSQEPLQPDFQQLVGRQLADYIRQNLGNYTPGEGYPGRLSITEPSAYETLGLNRLGGFLEGPETGDLFGAARRETLKTLGGDYADPSTSPFIQSITKLAGQNLDDAITAARGRRGARGTYFTTAGMNEERLLQERTLNALNSVLGEFTNQERGRQFSAIPFGQALDEYQNLEVPLKRIGASQTLGSLERVLEQADLERQYKAYLNQRGELEQLPGQAQSFYGTNVPYGIKTYTQTSPSTLMKILGEFNPIAGSYNTAQYGYTTNQTSIGQMIQLLAKIAGAGAGAP